MLRSLSFVSSNIRSTASRNINRSMATDTTTPANEYSVAFVTVPDNTVAVNVGRQLVEKSLVACVNIIPGLTSIYAWEGKINEDPEVLMMIKTRTSRVEELIRFVREIHPYSVAEVIAFPIAEGNAPYLDWIGKTVPKGGTA
ncbi:protein CutA homolog [Anopheles funestus]|uniref:protein CutA homolog n=1 Tax=Anopheles funestus TaxID=62324 RepID=UPI0020C5E19E|nr:protein CutA homolog [Anopheles funestus]